MPDPSPQFLSWLAERAPHMDDPDVAAQVTSAMAERGLTNLPPMIAPPSSDGPETATPAVDLSNPGRATHVAPRSVAQKGRLPTSYEPDGPDISLNDRQRAMWFDPAQNEGEDDAAYMQRADDAWQGAVQTAEREGRPAVRHRYTQGMEWLLSPIPAYAGAMAMGLSGGRYMGIPDREIGSMAPEEAARIRQMANGATYLPGMQELQGASDLLGAFSEGSLPNAISGGIGKLVGPARQATKLVGKTWNAARNYFGGIVGAAADTLGREAVGVGEDVLDRTRTGQPLPSAPELRARAGQALDRAEEAGGNAALAGPAMALAQRAGFGRVQSLRGAANVGSQLTNIEHADGRTTMNPFSSGIVPPPAAAEARKIAAMPRERTNVTSVNPPAKEWGMEARNITQKRATDQFHKDLHAHRVAQPQQIRAEQEEFFGSRPEAENLVSLEPAIRAVQARVAKNTDHAGRPLPGYSDAELAADQRLLGSLQSGELVARGEPQAPTSVPLREARERGIPVDEKELSKRASDDVANRTLVTNPKSQTMELGGRPTTAMLPPPIPNKQTVDQLRKQGVGLDELGMQKAAQQALDDTEHVDISPRTVNARRLEQMINNYQSQLPIKRNVRGERIQAENDVLSELYKLRKAPEFNPDAVYGPNGEIVTPGHFDQMTTRHAKQMADLEDLFVALGENRHINEIRPEDRTHYEPLANFVRNYHAADVTLAESYPAFEQFMLKHPELEQLMINAAGHRDLDLLERSAHSPARGMLEAGGPNIVAGIGDRSMTWARLHADPAMRALGGTGKGNQPVEPTINARRAGVLGSELEENKTLATPSDYFRALATRWVADKFR